MHRLNVLLGIEASEEIEEKSLNCSQKQVPECHLCPDNTVSIRSYLFLLLQCPIPICYKHSSRGKFQSWCHFKTAQLRQEGACFCHLFHIHH